MAASKLSDATVVAELEAVLHGSENREGYYTTEEWGELLGREAQAVRRRLRAMERLGRLERKTWFTPNFRGHMSETTGYRILPAP